MNFVRICLLASPLLLAAAASDSGAISSSSASYDGSALILKGQVALDHGLGKMRAEEAILQKQENNQGSNQEGSKEFPFSSIELNKGIHIDLQDHAQLQCGHANLDFSALHGKLLSSEKERVVYTDLLKRGGNQENPLRLTSDVVDLNLEKIAHARQKSEFLVRDIVATGNVVIDYAHTLVLKAGKAHYQKGGETALRAYPASDAATCTIQRGDDLIHTDTVDIDVNRQVLFLKNPHGHFHPASLSTNQKGELRFKSDQLMWDHPQNTLHLQGNVHVEENSFGTLDVDRELLLVQKELDGITSISSLQSLGNTLLQFQDMRRETMHRMTCRGQVILDHEKKNAVLESPHTSGVVAQENQLYYEEGELAVYADRGVIDYAQQDNRLRPSSISLKGHVRIISLHGEAAPRFGLADWVTYSPMTRTFILSAHPGSRVLFWDEKENLRISAQEIHLTQDGNRTTEAVKGVGNVQFSFTTDEEALVQKIFGLTAKK